MSVPYYGDFAEDDTVDIIFNAFTSNDPSASATITNFINTDVHIHKDLGLTQRNNAAGITVSVDFDGITGNHAIKIDTSDDTVAAFWVTGSEYQVRIEGTTVDGATINAWVGSFSIERAGGVIALLKLIQAAVITNAAGVDIAADIIAVKAETASILDDTDLIDDGTNGLAAIKAEVEGLAGAAMRGTDDAALASVCTEARLSELDAGTAGKAANQVDIIEADTTSLNDTKIPDTISLANINAQVDTALTDIDLDHLIQVDAGAEEPTDGAYLDQIMHKAVGQTFDPTTDSLEAIRDTAPLGTAMRGTDGANTTVPDAAGVAAGLHATTDGLINTAQADLDIITDGDGVILGAAAVDLIWDEDVDTSHQTAGTAGKKLDDAGGAADPWSTALPGAYGAGTAGKIVGDNVNAPIATVDTVVDGIQTDLSNGTDGLGALKALIDALNDLASADITTACTSSLNTYDPPTRAELTTDKNSIIAEVDANEVKIDALNDISTAQVNAEVVDALNVDTYAEPGQEAPGATLSLAKKISYLFKAWRNKKDNNGTTRNLYADDTTTVDQKSAVAEAAGTVTTDEWGSGP